MPSPHRGADPLATALAEPVRTARGLAVAHVTDDEAEALPILLDATRRLLAREADADAIDRERRLPRALIESAAAAGLFGLTVPAEHGGAGFSLKSACAVVAAIAAVERSTAITVGLHAGLGTRPLVELGSDALQRRFLPAIASGERIASFAATEAGAGSDLTAIRTTGTLDGDDVRLDGEKAYVTNGGFAGLFTVLARTPGLGGARAHSLVCVPRETPGVSIGAEEEKLGIRGSSTVTVRFDGARVPRAFVLGEAGKGLDQAHAALAWGRTLMAAGCVGTGRAALEATLAHVSSRRQFGEPIGTFGASRAHVAWMAGRLFAMESLVRWVGHALAAGEPIDALSTSAKVFASEGAFETCDRAVQLHGALGFIEPVGVARLLRDCRITRIFEGANDVLLVRLGAAVLSRGSGPELPALAAVVPAELRGAALEWDRVSIALRAAATEVRHAYGVAVVRHQLVLQAIARASIALHAACAALLRASAPSRDDDLALARHAVEDLVLEAKGHLASLARAGRDEERASTLTARLYEADHSSAPRPLEVTR